MLLRRLGWVAVEVRHHAKQTLVEGQNEVSDDSIFRDEETSGEVFEEFPQFVGFWVKGLGVLQGHLGWRRRGASQHLAPDAQRVSEGTKSITY